LPLKSSRFSAKVQEALLCFEQSIKHDNSQKAVEKSLFEITKIKIEMRDFYSAFHTLNRFEYLKDFSTFSLEKFRNFIDSVRVFIEN